MSYRPLTREQSQAEYAEAVRLMGDRRTDLGALARAVGEAYILAPDDLAPHFAALLDQIERRRLILTMHPPDWAA